MKTAQNKDFLKKVKTFRRSFEACYHYDLLTSSSSYRSFLSICEDSLEDLLDAIDKLSDVVSLVEVEISDNKISLNCEGYFGHSFEVQRLKKYAAAVSDLREANLCLESCFETSQPKHYDLYLAFKEGRIGNGLSGRAVDIYNKELHRFITEYPHENLEIEEAIAIYLNYAVSRIFRHLSSSLKEKYRKHYREDFEGTFYDFLNFARF